MNFNSIRRYLENFLFIEPASSFCAEYLSYYFDHLQWVQWHKGSPEWFDHRIDLYRWKDHLNPHWLERGIYSKEVMFPGCRILDVASGDGFYAQFFYVSTGAKIIDCIDINSNAIKHAKKYHRSPSIRYFLLDAVKDPFPESQYDVVCFDGAMDHFTHQALDRLLPKIKASLGNDGVLTGYQELGFHEVSGEHPISFDTNEELAARFKPFFKHVGLIITETPGRRNAYFRCSDNEQKVRRFA